MANSKRAAWIEPLIESLDIRETESGWGGGRLSDGGDWADDTNTGPPAS